MDIQKMSLPDLSQAVVLEEQELDRNEAWNKVRMDKFTSSNVYKLMTYLDKPDILPKGAITYIEEIVIAIKTNGQGIENVTSYAMDHGTEKEPFAVTRFEKEKGVECYAIGDKQEFVTLCSYFGGTPDGLFGTDDLIEVKCPNSKTHFSNLRELVDVESFQKKYPQYYGQIQGNLLATGRKTGWFISYDDRFVNEKDQILILEIPRDEEYISKLKKRLTLAEAYKKQLLAD
ncbi:hypothetical protein CMT62_13275 [Elizabethkingia anophelis]|nr:hypothetical protein [Elizabethkingia anophelis]MDV3655203.1 hypothetical protein [Elizabethkingia anophelis]MDV3888492.1 hypothetical protein [Elizabethkingia anophelis]MDV3894652.1 hypothetical protein [Elizabethkingia anophelis]MDV3917979.1 hypothetical protein [Elizabethkingia anophelis]